MSTRPDNWEERLANVRARQKPADPEGSMQSGAGKKAAKFYQSKIGETPAPEPEQPEPDPDSDSEVLVSVDDVLQTANLNDRMEMARLRHGQILALKGLKNGANGQSGTAAGLKDTSGAAKANGAADLAEIKSRSALETIAAPVAAAVQPDADRKKRRAGVIMAFAAMVALVVAAGFSGTGRAFLDGLIGGDTNTQATLELPEPSTGATAASTPTQAAPVTAAPQPVEPEPVLLAGSQIFSDFGRQPLSPEIDTAGAQSAFAAEFAAPGVARLANVALGAPAPEIAPNGSLGDLVPVYATVAKPTATLAAEQPQVSGGDVVQIGPAPSVLGNIELLSATGILAEPSVDAVTPARISAISSAPDVEQLELFASLTDLSPQALQPIFASRVQVTLAPGFGVSAGDPGISNDTTVPVQFTVPLPLIAAPDSLVPPTGQQVFALLSDAPSPSPTPVSAGEPFQFSSLVVHAPAGLADRDVDLIVTAFRDAGFDIGPPRKVGFNISKTNVRFFHSADGDGARALAEIVGGVARDFTDFRPKPPAGTVEVWLAGRSGGTTRRPSSSGGARAENPAILQLRDRLVESLGQW